MSIVALARPEIQALHPYDAAAQVDDTIRLNANESPLRCSIGNFRRPLNRYPEVRPVQLREALAQHFGCLSDQLLVTRGSSEAIDLIVRTFCRAGQDSVLTTSPSFSMYRHYTKVQGANLIEVQTLADRDFEIDVHAILAACDESTRVIFICSPNNPTGTVMPRKDLEYLLERRKDNSAVVVDEAYVEFAAEASVGELLDRFDNLLVLRTLSKALGFAGVRCGAVIGQADVVRMLSAVLAPYAIATPVIECVEEALQDEYLELARKAVREVISERERLAHALAGYDFVTRIWPSDANFLLIRLSNADRVMSRCAESDVLLRHFAGDLDDCIRISIGSREENDALLRVLDTLKDGDDV